MGSACAKRRHASDRDEEEEEEELEEKEEVEEKEEEEASVREAPMSPLSAPMSPLSPVPAIGRSMLAAKLRGKTVTADLTELPGEAEARSQA